MGNWYRLHGAHGSSLDTTRTFFRSFRAGPSRFTRGLPGSAAIRLFPAHIHNQYITAFGKPADGTLGTCGRNSLRGPGFRQWDANLIKMTKLTERLNLQFRWEVFNVINHPNFGPLPSVLSTLGVRRFRNHYLDTRWPQSRCCSRVASRDAVRREAAVLACELKCLSPRDSDNIRVPLFMHSFSWRIGSSVFGILAIARCGSHRPTNRYCNHYRHGSRRSHGLSRLEAGSNAALERTRASKRRLRTGVFTSSTNARFTCHNSYRNLPAVSWSTRFWQPLTRFPSLFAIVASCARLPHRGLCQLHHS